MKKILSCIWEAPQKALAHIVKWITKTEVCGTWLMGNKELHIYRWRLNGGLSLSNHIFLPLKHFDITVDHAFHSKWHVDYILHEYGHTIQSRKLGPLYLLAVGLPSIVWAGCFKNYRKKKDISYYSVYPENWADKLGGVRRED